MPSPRHRGTTLLELVVVLAIIGLTASLAVVGIARALDAAHVRAAARDVASMFTLARDRAMATGRFGVVLLDDTHPQVRVRIATDTVSTLDLGANAVMLQSTRDSMAYTSTGLGFGAANLRVIVSRGRSHDTLTVSRLGRVKR
jgi:prepilin-type N-terminal cleavage/methylation domain-containing protein